MTMNADLRENPGGIFYNIFLLTSLVQLHGPFFLNGKGIFLNFVHIFLFPNQVACHIGLHITQSLTFDYF